MKQCIIILAHNDIDQLIHLVDYFYMDCDVFIHIDKRTIIDKTKLAILESKQQVKAVIQKYCVHWGGFSILKTQMFMLSTALKQSDADNFHVISGHDYPIKPLSYFLSYFDRNKDKDFISFGRLRPIGTDLESCYRYQYFFPYDYSQTRQILMRKTKKWLNLQKLLHVNRGIPMQFEKLYCGSQWFSVTRDTVNTIVNYSKFHHSFLRRMKYTFAPEETYFLTIILNLCRKDKIVNRNMRFIRWHYENGNSPANLGKEHFHLLAETDDLFARKIVVPCSNTLISLIDKYLLSDNTVSIQNDGTWNCSTFVKYEYDSGFTEALYTYCMLKPCFEALDAGCGCGFYVAALRRLGIFATGIDSNPNTPQLSSLLLPDGDEPCQCANLAEVEKSETFKLVFCINVLQYINDKAAYYTTVKNLTLLASSSLIVAYDESMEKDKEKMTVLQRNLLENKFAENNFATHFFQKKSRKILNIHVYEH